MANTSTILVLEQFSPLDFPSGSDKRRQLNHIAGYLQAVASGNKVAHSANVWADGAAPTVAAATLTASGAAGTVGGVINGVSVTVTHGATDTIDASAIAAAILASSNALVQFLVKASNFASTLTLTSVLAGDYVDILGYRLIAITGTPTAADQFDRSGTDTQDASALVTAINAMPGLKMLVSASSSTNVVTLSQVSGTASAGTILASSTIAITAFAASTTVLVTAAQPGISGNCITFAATGTGMTASAARLSGGGGGGVTPVAIQL